MGGSGARIASVGACAIALCLVVSALVAPALVNSVAAQPKPQQPTAPAQTPAQAKPPAPAQQPNPKDQSFDICTGLTGAKAARKVEACNEAIAQGGLSMPELAVAYLHRGLSESGPGSDTRSKADYRQSIRILSDLILTQPLNPYLYIQRGVVHQQIGEADRAIVDFSDAIRLAPKETAPLIHRGIILYTRKDNSDGAIADLTAALAIKNCDVSGWINRGIAYKRKADLDQAIKDFTDGIKCLPPNVQPVNTKELPDNVTKVLLRQRDKDNHWALLAAFSYYQRGLVYYDKQLYDKSIADFTQAIHYNPDDAAPFVGRGAAYMYKNDT
ncbi:MAG: tetratricopeptide repeat protein, partial [Reyranella sp.]|uniref:tetratricopeptide repeat protein n=1 Tax=Reyranella sp. TaxID=1929291 RepID=UPI003D0C279A